MLMKLTFPGSTKGLGLKSDGGMDQFTWLKVAMSPADFASFIAQPPFAGASFRTDRRYPASGPKVNWWRASDAKHYRSTEVYLDNGADGALSILADLDRADEVIVYLFWMKV
jgi:hypothetical protein